MLEEQIYKTASNNFKIAAGVNIISVIALAFYMGVLNNKVDHLENHDSITSNNALRLAEMQIELKQVRKDIEEIKNDLNGIADRQNRQPRTNSPPAN